MDFSISNVISMVTAFAALIGVILSAVSTRQQIAAQTITSNRMDWIKEVRELLKEFVTEYVRKENADYQKMRELKGKVELYLKEGEEDYDILVRQMDYCCTFPYSEEGYFLLIRSSQYVLNRTWQRLALEGKGKLLRSNRLIRKKVDSATEIDYQNIKGHQEKYEEEHGLPRSTGKSI